MSQAVLPMAVVQTLTPRSRISTERFYAVVRGGSFTSYRQNVSTSFSDSQIFFSATPPSPQTIIDRKVYIMVTIHVAGTGTPAAPATTVLQFGRTSAPRAFSFSQCVDTLSVKLNNTNVQINLNNVLQALLWVHNPCDQRRQDFSETPSMLDQSPNYSQLIDFNRNPLGRSGDAGSCDDEPRGGFAGVNNYVDVGGVFSFDLTVCEPIILPPFYYGSGEQSGLFGIQNMDFQFNISNLTRVLSHATAAGISGVITSLTASVVAGAASAGGVQPTLLTCFIRPQNVPALPRSVTYPYYQITDYITQAATLAPGATSTSVSNLIQVGSIPKVLYIWLRRRNQDRTFLTTDTFAYISNVSITWNTENGLLASANPRDLYNMSIKNGVNMSWTEWAGSNRAAPGAAGTGLGGVGVGSILAIDFGDDISLDSVLYSAGSLGQYMLQVQCTYTNISPLDTINYDMYIVPSFEGVLTVADSSCILQTGVISKEDVFRSMAAPMVSYSDVQAVSGKEGGASFFSKVRTLYDRPIPYLSTNGLSHKSLTGIGGRGMGGQVVGAGLSSNDQDSLYQTSQDDLSTGQKHKRSRFSRSVDERLQ